MMHGKALPLRAVLGKEEEKINFSYVGALGPLFGEIAALWFSSPFSRLLESKALE